MTEATLSIVNAFTANGRNGNPAGIMLSADNLSEADMLRIAAKVGLSETAFVSNSNKATRKVRFFTPTTEVDLCGHATIAAWAFLHETDELKSGEYTQETLAGILQVIIQDDELVFMEQTKAKFSETITPATIAPLLGVKESDFSEELQPQIVSTGLRDLLVPVRHKSVLKQLQPKLNAITEFSRQQDISGLHVFALLADEQSIAAARNFAPADGIPEESATGTSNGALLCYLKKNNALPPQDSYQIEQGEAMGRLSYINGLFKNDTVWIGGRGAVIEQRKIAY